MAQAQVETQRQADIERTAIYATKPTQGTLFWRTFLPWQFWRFIRINWKMLRLMRKSHHGL